MEKYQVKNKYKKYFTKEYLRKYYGWKKTKQRQIFINNVMTASSTRKKKHLITTESRLSALVAENVNHGKCSKSGNLKQKMW